LFDSKSLINKEINTTKYGESIKKYLPCTPAITVAPTVFHVKYKPPKTAPIVRKLVIPNIIVTNGTLFFTILATSSLIA